MQACIHLTEDEIKEACRLFAAAHFSGSENAVSSSVELKHTPSEYPDEPPYFSAEVSFE
jgi:hypothetical protein